MKNKQDILNEIRQTDLCEVLYVADQLAKKYKGSLQAKKYFQLCNNENTSAFELYNISADLLLLNIRNK